MKPQHWRYKLPSVLYMVLAVYMFWLALTGILGHAWNSTFEAPAPTQTTPVFVSPYHRGGS
ncbi:hypothetical protein [Mycobacteroides abscessus]|uniref:Uncharacterized protein n=1 Tax=Mycobacteroides abscessus subsp. bolletii CRM-0020 TaxID=1306401 RepID=A0A829HNT2_9MYCO|nr:hypothetical protein [Mycobacteroides abscessus]EPQ21005.1 hypothetical protein J108_23635 [Mycobacteroides abscessus subsp. bolletii CRM-0020]MBN7488194.1 hypothetical protein [Mycobacteroides abscessus subsp. abscessus]RIS77896.1 hypothetical protein D2E54_15180 [Mycobacteroides abscessus]SHY45960.1 Uncharacterised protein [Mycobacteroides abscessus subsp. abscessus]SKQ73866.1 Uncharacterised protein [Mycobacteroides abscessus subsp. massiliense]